MNLLKDESGGIELGLPFTLMLVTVVMALIALVLVFWVGVQSEITISQRTRSLAAEVAGGQWGDVAGDTDSFATLTAATASEGEDIYGRVFDAGASSWTTAIPGRTILPSVPFIVLDNVQTIAAGTPTSAYTPNAPKGGVKLTVTAYISWGIAGLHLREPATITAIGYPKN